MLASRAHSTTQQARLAITLAGIAGWTNIVSILACGTAVSHATGSASNLARFMVARSWQPALLCLHLLVCFVVGAMLSGLLTDLGRRRRWESIYILPAAVQGVLLLAFAIGVELHDPQSRATGWVLVALTGLASLAMGVQNATITRISSGVVRTTHLTGVLTDFGLEVAHRVGLRGQNPHPQNASRLVLLSAIAGSFVVGSAGGTLAWETFPRLSMLPPVLLLLWIIVQDVRTPICEVETSREHEGLSGLPEGLVVYTLRGKGAGPARLPDLLAWCEGLPLHAKVVILDVEAAQLVEENDALELLAFHQAVEASGRQLILSGLGPSQYALLRAADVTTHTLSPQDVCPDLDLAIARGMLLSGG